MRVRLRCGIRVATSCAALDVDEGWWARNAPCRSQLARRIWAGSGCSQSDTTPDLPSPFMNSVQRQRRMTRSTLRRPPPSRLNAPRHWPSATAAVAHPRPSRGGRRCSAPRADDDRHASPGLPKRSRSRPALAIAGARGRRLADRRRATARALDAISPPLWRAVQPRCFTPTAWSSASQIHGGVHG